MWRDVIMGGVELQCQCKVWLSNNKAEVFQPLPPSTRRLSRRQTRSSTETIEFQHPGEVFFVPVYVPEATSTKVEGWLDPHHQLLLRDVVAPARSS